MLHILFPVNAANVSLWSATIPKLAGTIMPSLFATAVLNNSSGCYACIAKHRQDPAPRHVSTYGYDSGLFLICCEEMLLSVGLSAGHQATPVQLTDPLFR